MPYIKQIDRDRIDPLIKILFEELKTKGNIIYAIGHLLRLFIQREDKKYTNLNDAMGIIECVKQEFYRKVVAPYKEQKIILVPDLKQKDREVDPLIKALFKELKTKGDMNYAITRILHLFIQREGKICVNLDYAMGIVKCAKQDFYSKVVAPYEEEKIILNGDIQ